MDESDDDMRVSDVDRARVQDRLRQAQDVGLLDLSEFDERAKAAWAARTRGELARITRDLPAIPASAPPARRQVFAPTGGGNAMRILTIIWSSLVVTNLLVWGILALTGETTYPWFLWLLVPGGVLAVLYGFGIGRPERD